MVLHALPEVRSSSGPTVRFFVGFVQILHMLCLLILNNFLALARAQI